MAFAATEKMVRSRHVRVALVESPYRNVCRVRAQLSTARSRACTQFSPQPNRLDIEEARYAVTREPPVQLPNEVLVLAAVTEEDAVLRIRHGAIAIAFEVAK